jgi:hypothetical protein
VAHEAEDDRADDREGAPYQQGEEQEMPIRLDWGRVSVPGRRDDDPVKVWLS